MNPLSNPPRMTLDTCLDALRTLWQWEPPEGVRKELTVLQEDDRGAILVVLDCGGCMAFVEVHRPPDADAIRELEREARVLVEAAWELAGTVTTAFPFDVDAIPRG